MEIDGMMRLCDDALIPQYEKLVDVAHEENCPIIAQLALGAYYREGNGEYRQVERGGGDKMLPFPFMGWVECTADTAYDWQFSGMLNNVHTAEDGDFSQVEQITHGGALLVGTYTTSPMTTRQNSCGT